MSFFDEIFKTLGSIFSGTEGAASSSNNYGGLGISQSQYQTMSLIPLLELKRKQLRGNKHEDPKLQCQAALIRDIRLDLKNYPNEAHKILSNYLLIETAMRLNHLNIARLPKNLVPGKSQPLIAVTSFQGRKVDAWLLAAEQQQVNLALLLADAFLGEKHGSLHNILIGAVRGAQMVVPKSHTHATLANR